MNEPIVQTTGGKVRGQWIDKIATFRGVPFAAPPVGKNWLLAPQPVEPWPGVRGALEYGATAPQAFRPSTIIPEPIKAGDDYLNLNLYTPDLGAARLPVMLWIHGGGYFAGCNQAAWFNGKRFARDGVVAVGINYRLGFEGFMPVQGAPMNRGVLDWLAGLDWVRQNVAAFGGDPDNVTIAGQSAGAGACATLLVTPRAKSLFKRAGLMSGSTGFGGSPEMANAFARQFGRVLGVEPTREALAAIPTDRLIAAQVEAGADAPADTAPAVMARWFARGLQLQPVVDGDLLPERPEVAIRAGVSKDIPVLMSATTEEFNFLFDQQPVDDAVLAQGLEAFGLRGKDATTYRAHHPGSPPASVLGQTLSDSVFRVPMTRVAEARLDAPASSFVYEFRWRYKTRTDGGMGSHHCLDVPFAFDLLDAEGVTQVAGTNPPQALADQMHRAWVDFIKTGNPGWPAWRAGERKVMAYDTESKLVDDPLTLERTLWPFR